MVGTRVVQWTTGAVARHAVKSVLERPDLDLVGAYAFSAEKVGRDVGDLIGVDPTVGVAAQMTVQAFIDLKPDCVLEYAAAPRSRAHDTSAAGGHQHRHHGRVRNRSFDWCL